MRTLNAKMLLLFVAGTAVYAQTAARYSNTERLADYARRTYSWERMALLGIDSAVDQLMGEPREWGHSPETIGYRYGSTFGRRVIRNSIELGAGTVLGEDDRLNESHGKGLWQRMRFAAIGSFTGLDSRGNRRFAWARLIATVGGTAIAAQWQPCRMSPGGIAGQVGSGYLGHLQNSFLTEFSPDAVRFGKRVRVRVFGR